MGDSDPTNLQLIDTPGEGYILSLDVGTTTIRCYVYDAKAKTVGYSDAKMELIYPRPGEVEIEPEKLWEKVKLVIQEAISRSGLSAGAITCMGITNQRNTFITWNRETGEYLHNFIVWQDVRASELVKDWNSSFTMKGFRGASNVLHAVTQQRRFFGASVLRFQTTHITIRLVWALNNIEKLRQEAEKNNVCFGMLDTWLLWKLTGGKVFNTEYSNASSTGFYDPYQLHWSQIVMKMTGIPSSIMPEPKDTSGLFGYCDSKLFGAHIPITSMIADQQASMFGQCCFEPGDVKLSLGTGLFIDMNSGKKPHASIAGLYPLIGWKIGKKVQYLAEGIASDAGQCIEWIKSLGMFEDYEELSPLAESVEDTDGCYFIPAFSGLQAPINNERATSLLIGMTPKTTKAHIIRAVLESLAFRCKLLFETLLKESKTDVQNNIRVDGGVSNNDFILQSIADLTGCNVTRTEHHDKASLGAAFLAGLAVGIWKDQEELRDICKTERVFQHRNNFSDYKHKVSEWERALNRSINWHNPDQV